MTRGIRAFAIALAMFACPAPAADAAEYDPDNALELAVKAAFLYKFGVFIKWPDSVFTAPDGPFDLCVVGGRPIGPLLDRAVANQRYGDHPVVVSQLTETARAEQCQLLYIATDDPRIAVQFLAPVRDLPVLTVTNAMRDEDAKGIINFVVADDRVRFEIDGAAAARSGLVISSKLLSLAVGAKAGP
jgi:hypothetical protein